MNIENAAVLIDKEHLKCRQESNRVGLITPVYVVKARNIDMYAPFCPNEVAVAYSDGYHKYKLLTKIIIRGRLVKATYLKEIRDFLDFEELHIHFD